MCCGKLAPSHNAFVSTLRACVLWCDRGREKACVCKGGVCSRVFFCFPPFLRLPPSSPLSPCFPPIFHSPRFSRAACPFLAAVNGRQLLPWTGPCFRCIFRVPKHARGPTLWAANAIAGRFRTWKVPRPPLSVYAVCRVRNHSLVFRFRRHCVLQDLCSRPQQGMQGAEFGSLGPEAGIRIEKQILEDIMFQL